MELNKIVSQKKEMKFSAGKIQQKPVKFPQVKVEKVKKTDKGIVISFTKA